MSTDAPRAFELDAGWTMSAEVSVRTERFGALLYHFGNRRLSFLKSRKLCDVVRGLSEAETARHACAEAGVTTAEMAAYTRALAGLAASDMIRERGVG